jgi:succinyl-CoA synthetase beta subunit
MRRFRNVKIVATLGPSSEDYDTIRALHEAGADVFRLNMSHGDHDSIREKHRIIRQVEEDCDSPICILDDLQGPKLRVGAFAKEEEDLIPGAPFRLDLDPAEGDATRVCLPHPEIFQALEPGASLLVNDGKIRLKVKECGPDFAECEVMIGGVISNRKGVNVPDVVLPLAALSEKDRADLEFVCELGVDWLALSFVQRPEDVTEARELAKGRAALLSKIEKPSAVDRFEDILAVSDGIMVARGDLGVELPELSEKTRARLQNILPAAASIPNPVDVAGGTDADPSVFADCAEIILKDPNVGGLLIVGLFGGYGIRFAESLALMEEDAAHRMGKLIKKRNKPIVLHSLYNHEKPHALDLLRYYNIPVYDSLDISTKCMAVLVEYGSYLGGYHGKVSFELNWKAKARPEGDKIIKKALRDGRRALLEYEAKKLFEIHGAPVPQDCLVQSADEAVQCAMDLGTDVAMKIVSPDILHKSDAGGVRIKLTSEKEIRSAYREILKNSKKYDAKADIRGVLVSPMADEGVEVIIGTKTDDQFGPVIMYGLGGVMVEILKDVAFRVLPLSPTDARKMIVETKSYPILDGARGAPALDKKALRRLLMLCSDIVESYPQIEEMDLNPVIVHEKGVSVVDARIILKTEDRSG